MPDGGRLDSKPHGTPIHATAVAISGRGLLILGPSGCGKSRLAFALTTCSTERTPIMLIGDDRVLVSAGPSGLVVRAHPRIAGFIERRGLGIVAVPFVHSAPVAGIIDLGLTTLPAILSQNLAGLPNVSVGESAMASTADAALRWWRDACTTPAAKASVAPLVTAKD